MDMPANNLAAKKTFIYYLVLIGVAGLLMRILIGEVFRPVPHYGAMTSDYFNYASNMIAHRTYSYVRSDHPTPDSLRVPLYPMYLAGIRLLSGFEQWENWVAASQYLMGALICVLIVLLGTQISNARVGLLAGTMAIFYLDLIYMSVAFLRETLCIFLFLSALSAFVFFLKGGGRRWFLVSSALFGIGVLGRPETALVGPLLIILFWTRLKERLRKDFALAGTAILLAILPLLLWNVRNYRVHGHPVLFSTDSAWSFYDGQVWSPDETYTLGDFNQGRIRRETNSEYEWYARLNHEAFAAIIQHPLRNARWAWIKINITFQEFSAHESGLLFPIVFSVLVWAGLKRTKFRRWATLGGAGLGALYLSVAKWPRHAPIYLFHTAYSQVILLASIGFPLFIFKGKNQFWKILAAPFLTLIACSIIYIPLLRERILLCDWVLLICASYLLIFLFDFVSRRSEVPGKQF